MCLQDLLKLNSFVFQKHLVELGEPFLFFFKLIAPDTPGVLRRRRQGYLRGQQKVDMLGCTYTRTNNDPYTERMNVEGCGDLACGSRDKEDTRLFLRMHQEANPNRERTWV